MSNIIKCDYCGAMRTPYDYGTWTTLRREIRSHSVNQSDESYPIQIDEHMCIGCTEKLSTIRQDVKA